MKPWTFSRDRSGIQRAVRVMHLFNGSGSENATGRRRGDGSVSFAEKASFGCLRRRAHTFSWGRVLLVDRIEMAILFQTYAILAPAACIVKSRNAANLPPSAVACRVSERSLQMSMRGEADHMRPQCDGILICFVSYQRETEVPHLLTCRGRSATCYQFGSIQAFPAAQPPGHSDFAPGHSLQQISQSCFHPLSSL